MLVKIISTATLIVLAWLAVQMLHTQKSIDEVEVNFQGALADVQDALADVRSELSDASTHNDSKNENLLARMDSFSAEQVKLAKSTKAASAADPKVLKAKNQTITRLKESQAMHNAYAMVLRAELAGIEKQGAAAAKLLSSTKSVIWKTSGKWNKSKDPLRGLMGPIDSLVGKWERGDYSGNTKAIQKVLLGVLKAQPKS